MMFRLLIVALLFVAAPAPAIFAQQPDAAALIAEFTGTGDPQPRSPEALRSAFDAMLDSLLPGMGAEKIEDREKPQQTLERLCNRAGRPGAEPERAAFCTSIAARLGSTAAKPARVWMLRRLETVGNEECIAALVACLAESDAELRDAARRALQCNPSGAARQALLKALDDAKDASMQVALINALAARGEFESAPAFVSRIKDGDANIATAALTALGELRRAEHLPALLTIWKESAPPLRRAAGNAISRTCERLIAEGKNTDAATAYQQIYDTSPLAHVKAAALIGLARAQGDAALPALRKAYQSADAAHLRPIAVRAAGELAGDAAGAALIEDLKSVEPATQIVIIDVLVQRDEKAAAAPIKAFVSDDAAPEEVRIAALEGLARIGAVDDSRAAIAIAATATGPLQKSARTSLARYRAPIDDALLSLAKNPGDVTTRSECVRALGARRTGSALPTLFSIVTDAEARLQTTCYEAIGELAEQSDVPMCVRALTQAQADARMAAEDMLATVCLRNADKEARVRPLLEELHSGEARHTPSLIRVLGRLEGAYALAAVRQAAEDDGNAELADVGIRALAGWSAAEVLPDLDRVIRDMNTQPVHRTLAIRGLSRLVRLPSERAAQQTFEMLERAWKLAARPDERKALLAALPSAAIAASLELAQSALAQADLKEEAATATLSLAKSLAAADRDAAEKAIKAVLAADCGEKVREAAKSAEEWLEKFRGYIREWQYCGPYTAKGKSAGTLFDVAFPPEPGNPALPADATGSVPPEWKPLAAYRTDNPWYIDFTLMDKAGSRCMYIRTTIASAEARPARLELGSDDGVEVWWNGAAIHRKITTRPVAAGDDKLDIDLKAGDNTLLMKITQGEGGWGACAGVRGRDGAPLTGISFRAE